MSKRKPGAVPLVRKPRAKAVPPPRPDAETVESTTVRCGQCAGRGVTADVGSGIRQCTLCNGVGHLDLRVKCSTCLGTGELHTTSLGVTKARPCWTCHGDGLSMDARTAKELAEVKRQQMAQMYAGGSTVIAKHLTLCDLCSGTGMMPTGSGHATCTKCRGRGHVPGHTLAPGRPAKAVPQDYSLGAAWDEFMLDPEEPDCTTCKGEGAIPSAASRTGWATCPACQGAGKEAG